LAVLANFGAIRIMGNRKNFYISTFVIIGSLAFGYLLANFNISGRTIGMIVATYTLTLYLLIKKLTKSKG